MLFCVCAGTVRLWRKETALAQALKRCAQAVVAGAFSLPMCAFVSCHVLPSCLACHWCPDCVPPLAQRRSVQQTMTLLDKLSKDDDEDDCRFLDEEEEEEKRDNLGSMGGRPSHEHGGVHVHRPSRAATLESLAATLDELAALADEVAEAEVATCSTAVIAHSGAQAVPTAVPDSISAAPACELKAGLRPDTPLSLNHV